MIDPKDARRLLDAEAVEELLSLVTGEEVGFAWCRYATRVVREENRHDWEDDEDGWAAELYHESAFWTNENFARAFLVTLVDNAPDDVLGWVGAGPIEDFMGGAGEDQLLWIEGCAKESDRFRQALRSVAVWRSAPWERGDHRHTLVQKPLEVDPAIDAIIRRIQSRL